MSEVYASSMVVAMCLTGGNQLIEIVKPGVFIRVCLFDFDRLRKIFRSYRLDTRNVINQYNFKMVYKRDVF